MSRSEQSMSSFGPTGQVRGWGRPSLASLAPKRPLSTRTSSASGGATLAG
jgi:hypothetical protein